MPRALRERDAAKLRSFHPLVVFRSLMHGGHWLRAIPSKVPCSRGRAVEILAARGNVISRDMQQKRAIPHLIAILWPFSVAVLKSGRGNHTPVSAVQNLPTIGRARGRNRRQCVDHWHAPRSRRTVR
ncbi:hypothetical protein P153DRAFT_386167 [Dothidotthia symphoricarpi CBS 119687]|uniref:Uncharacterized protein n=1 Tax=Dothidotthia symphoricarpi CBS 119687 TaxID=1392245 RepID=A0A6A6AAX1_9PLEO|nr:uncharacterized protein P153DRAFT_386167 [Dothidotthia symphoricarpi CBS 119687]KAF2128970.1 hypothetical protein P153DRAFT_386167 [Dothidotthia symphoricarpi CBS 119687]